MPRLKKCQEKEQPPSRTVLESLDICSHHQRTCSTTEQQPRPQPPCSRQESESLNSLSEEICCTITCNNDPTVKKQESRNDIVECPKSCNNSNEQSSEDPDFCGCCPAGVQVKNIKEALDELKELQKQAIAASQGRLNTNGSCVPVNQKKSNMNIPCASQVQMKEDASLSCGTPECAVQNQGISSTEFERKQSQTYCPLKLPLCCHPEPLISPCPDSSKTQNVTDQQTSKHECQGCNAMQAPEVKLPAPTSSPSMAVRCQKNVAETKGSEPHLLNEGKPKLDIEKCCQSPVCGLPIKENEKPERRNSVKASAQGRPVKKAQENADKVKKKVKDKPCTGPCASTDDTPVPTKCECHFPPAYNQFGCTGNISGTCNCTNHC